MASTSSSDFFPRHAERTMTEALEDTRVVLINGARQCGKSTLVRQLAKGLAAEWRRAWWMPTTPSLVVPPSTVGGQEACRS
ncbi:AAA family ATPase [Nonomuraea fuscirosea]|uniref:AAA family ATPase n=1 Tax=Nonomuraea fuscirosea TaxID=1291556 RepID=UPI00342BD380